MFRPAGLKQWCWSAEDGYSCPRGCYNCKIGDLRHYFLHIIGGHNAKSNVMEAQNNLAAGLTKKVMEGLQFMADFDE
jgi:hypothetical protein